MYIKVSRERRGNLSTLYMLCTCSPFIVRFTQGRSFIRKTGKICLMLLARKGCPIIIVLFSKPYWQTPIETFINKLGDCEDGAILMVRMWLDAGIPAYQCKLCAGYVDVDYKLVGHAYAIYLKEHTNNWIIMDWCYWAGKVPARWRFNKSHADSPEYREIWWTSNDKISWAQHDIVIKDGLHD